LTTSQVYRISGLASLFGAITFAAHIVLRSVITAGLVVRLKSNLT